MTPERLSATYHLISTADAIEARALALAVEQSVEMPLAPIANPFVRDQIVGRVDSIRDLGDGSRFEVRLALSVASTGAEAGQLFNMLFGNSSIHDDVTLWDVELPPGLAAAFGGPRQGLAGWRRRFGTERRALAASALKPQGMTQRRVGPPGPPAGPGRARPDQGRPRPGRSGLCPLCRARARRGRSDRRGHG